MSVMEFAVHDRDDPNGTALATFTDADAVFNRDGEAMEFRVGLNQEGAGLINLSRHHPLANRTDIPDNAYIKPIIPSVSTSPIFGWWADEFRARLISADEQGGETIALFGPGIIDILRRAILWDVPYATGQPARGSLDMPGKWHWINEPRGAILTRGIEEGQEQDGEPLRHVTIDFSRTTSSAPESATWAVTDSIFEETIGIDIHSLYKQLIAAGDLIVVPEPNLLIHAYQAYGRDLTASVVFAKAGVSAEHPGNIITELTRAGRGTRKATHALVRGKDETYEHVVSDAYVDEPGQALFIPYDATDEGGLLGDVGAQTLSQRQADTEAIEFEITPGFDPDNGLYMPGPDGSNGHFWIGDTVTVISGTDANRWEETAERVVTGIRVVLAEAAKDDSEETAARSLRIIVECGGATQESPPQVPQPRITPAGLEWVWDSCSAGVVLPPGTWHLQFAPSASNLAITGTAGIEYDAYGGSTSRIVVVRTQVTATAVGNTIFGMKLPPKADGYYVCT